MSDVAKQVVAKPIVGPAPRVNVPSIARPTPTVPRPAQRPSDAPALALAPTFTRPEPSKEAKESAKDGETPSAEEQKPVYRFAKLWGVAEVLTFKDGTTYKFRLIKRNNASGYASTSSVETQDEKLAANLREAAKTNRSIREVPAK